jgi:predicted neuraminidase
MNFSKKSVAATAAFAAIALLALSTIAQRPGIDARFLVKPDARPATNSPISFVQHDLNAGTPSAHAASIVGLANGERLAFWFAGRREGAGDVKVYRSRLAGGKWSPPSPVASPWQTTRDEMRFVRKVGNPVAVLDQSGRMHLFSVSVSLGGWATSQLNQMTSLDGGETFGPARVLVTSPFFNISTLVRAPAVQRVDGGFDLPVYHELANKFPELLRFSASGEMLAKVRLHAAERALQPAIVATSEQRAVALQRNAGPQRRLIYQQSDDGGKSWLELQNLDVVNPDSSVALARFPDGELLLAYNPRPDGRSELALASSRDGKTWTKRRTLEYALSGEFSYPTLHIEGDTVDIVYTWQRKLIRHLRFDRSWLAGEQR